MHRQTTRLALASAGLLALAACVVNLTFNVDRDIVIDATGSSIPETVIAIDLNQYAEVQQHKANVQSLGFDYVDVKVASIASNNHATAVTGTVKLRANGVPDVLVGQLTNFAITAGASQRFNGSPEINTFLYNQLKGAGQFSIVVAGTTAGGDAHLTLHATGVADLGYGTGIF